MAVPLGATPAQALLGQGDVSLLGAGRLSGSLIIDADAIPLGFALSHRILLVRAIPELCFSGASNAQD